MQISIENNTTVTSALPDSKVSISAAGSQFLALLDEHQPSFHDVTKYSQCHKMIPIGEFPTTFVGRRHCEEMYTFSPKLKVS